MEKVRVLLTKSELDAHDRGIRYIANKLREGGFEVVFTRYAVIDEVVNSAIQEGVDVISISLSSGGHLYDIGTLMGLLKEKGLKFPVVVGGSIPYRDVPKILEMGVKRYFGPGADLSELTSYLAGLAADNKQ